MGRPALVGLLHRGKRAMISWRIKQAVWLGEYEAMVARFDPKHRVRNPYSPVTQGQLWELFEISYLNYCQAFLSERTGNGSNVV